MITISQYNTKLLNHIFNKANQLSQPHTLQYIIFPSRADAINSFSTYIFEYRIDVDKIDHDRLAINNGSNAIIKFMSIRDLKNNTEQDGYSKDHPEIIIAYHIYRFDTIYREYVLSVLNHITEHSNNTITANTLAKETPHLVRFHKDVYDLDEYPFDRIA